MVKFRWEGRIDKAMEARIGYSLLVAVFLSLSVTVNGCSCAAHRGDAMAIRMAKQEMRRRGWKRTEVGRCLLRDGLWEVQMHPHGDPCAFAFVNVSSNGVVEKVFVNTK